MASRSLLTCWTLLVVFAETCQASRFLTALQNEAAHSEGPQVIRAELLHRDHPNSPLAPANGTLLSVAERLAAGCQRSDERHRILAARRRLDEFETPVVLKGGFAGEYVMTISFGTPPQKFHALVDTGSDLVWVQCVACTGCFNFKQPDPLYDPDASSSDVYFSCNDDTCSDFLGAPPPCNSATGNTCHITYDYADGSQIAGTLTSETLTLTSSTTLTHFIIGCMNNNTGIFDNYDGIVGFGRGKYSLPSQFALHSYLQVFAYCLVPYTSTTTLSSPLLFGASDPTNAQGLAYTPLLTSAGDTLYYVKMTGISVNGEAVSSIPSKAFKADVLFDSGTPITQLFPEVYDGLQQAVADAVTYPVVQDATYFCFDVTGVTDPVLPTVTFHFRGEDGESEVDFKLKDENLYGPLVDVAGALCLAARALSVDNMVVGSVNQANHYIETDVVNMRMGWASKDCTSQ